MTWVSVRTIPGAPYGPCSAEAGQETTRNGHGTERVAPRSCSRMSTVMSVSAQEVCSSPRVQRTASPGPSLFAAGMSLFELSPRRRERSPFDPALDDVICASTQLLAPLLINRMLIASVLPAVKTSQPSTDDLGTLLRGERQQRSFHDCDIESHSESLRGREPSHQSVRHLVDGQRNVERGGDRGPAVPHRTGEEKTLSAPWAAPPAQRRSASTPFAAWRPENRQPPRKVPSRALCPCIPPPPKPLASPAA